MVVPGQLRLVGPTPSLDELPEVLTIEEAAKVLRIGRGAAYALPGGTWTAAGEKACPWCALGAAGVCPGRDCFGSSRLTSSLAHAAGE